MKQYFINLLLFFLLIQFAYSQTNYRVKYELNFQIDSTNSKSIQNEIMYLDIKKSKDSYFRPESIFLKDSILQSNNPQSLFSINKPKFNYTIEKVFNNNNISSYYDYTAFKFKLSESIDFKWEIINGSTKTVLDYKVHKATTSFKGRNYTAWYTNEISIQDGPYKFKGLPGLILELYDEKNHYHFKAFSIQELSDYKPYIVSEEYKLISNKDFNDFKERVKQKPSLVLQNPGIQIPKEGMDKYDRNHRERNKHKNNPIELKVNNQ